MYRGFEDIVNIGNRGGIGYIGYIGYIRYIGGIGKRQNKAELSHDLHMTAL